MRSGGLFKVAYSIVFITLGWSAIEPSRAADPASGSQPLTFDIGPQPLSSALNLFAVQSHQTILFTPEIAKGKISRGVKGTLAPGAALAQLLTGTGLVSSRSPEGMILVTPADAKGASATSDPLVAPNGAPNDQHQTSRTNETGPSRLSMLEEIIVTGSRIPLTAGQQAVQPLRGYSREVIGSSGQSTMGEFLNTLPDVSNFMPAQIRLGIAGAQTVQLHGLPVGTTLTLLDGRRMEASQLGFFDLSSIPVSAVERVEILPVGASAIYGADALAGAVNFILRKDFNGFEVNASLDHAAGVDDPGINAAWGRSWDRGSVSLIASYQHYGELLGTQRQPTSRTTFPSNFPTVALFNDSCSPGNVYSIDGSNLPGLSSPQAGIPADITGRPTIGQFAATAGKLNVCNAGRYADITPRSEREGALLSAHHELAEAADLFTEILLSHRYLRHQTGPSISVSQYYGGTVAANNPYNPFGVDVNVGYAYPGTALPVLQSSDLILPMLGVRGSLFSDWHYEATGTFSRDRLHYAAVYTDPTLVAAALASSNPATALNPFASGAPGSPQLLSSLINPAVDTSDNVYDDQRVSAQAILRGPLVHLPAGAVQAVMGGDWSHEEQNQISNGFPPLRLQRKTYAAFGEVRVPLLAGRAQPQAVERLTLTLAGRYDHSNDYDGKATWQGGLVWRATDELSFNGSYGQSYRAPQLREVSGPQTVSVGALGYTDPFRGNELATYPVTAVFGPNFNLKPESGRSSTLGLQYSSEALPGLHASVTWYDLAISNYIGIQNPQAVIDNPSLFPGAIVRAPPTPQDLQRGFLGVITRCNDLYYNFGDLRVKGVDADLSYTVDTQIGEFTPSLAIASIYKWSTALLPDTAAIDAVSKANFFGVGWAPRWKGTAALAWKRGPLTMNVAGRYVGRYLDYQEYVSNTNEIGNSWIVDLSARFELGEALGAHPSLAHAYVLIGAVNLLNKTPPFSYNPFWYDISEYDVRGRYLHLNVGVRF